MEVMAGAPLWGAAYPPGVTDREGYAWVQSSQGYYSERIRLNKPGYGRRIVFPHTWSDPLIFEPGEDRVFYRRQVDPNQCSLDPRLEPEIKRRTTKSGWLVQDPWEMLRFVPD